MNLGGYDPGGSLAWLSLGGTLFNFAVLAGIAWLVVSALALTGDQRDGKAAAIVATPNEAPEAATP